ncbi:hypothetical protein Micbo1qcDRAFT_70725 [Microdochium bolleyi]|uniref:Uncharacterized protein n=1 Tax=Microdochium bolleyi TaxID=196109 RepID=A0A136J070_9PEZI|nr:hypothetical protein Micbo1qcDRAFT_70725 [Microdochium bolleyi]
MVFCWASAPVPGLVDAASLSHLPWDQNMERNIDHYSNLWHHGLLDSPLSHPYRHTSSPCLGHGIFFLGRCLFEGAGAHCSTSCHTKAQPNPARTESNGISRRYYTKPWVNLTPGRTIRSSTAIDRTRRKKKPVMRQNTID